MADLDPLATSSGASPGPGPDPCRADPIILPLLAGGTTIAMAAAAAGVSERTVRRRSKDEDFRRALQSERSGIRRRLVDRLVDASIAAVSTLNALTDEDNAETTRLAAARATLEFTVRHLAVVDLNDRIADLEERAGVLGDGHGR